MQACFSGSCAQHASVGLPCVPLSIYDTSQFLLLLEAKVSILDIHLVSKHV